MKQYTAGQRWQYLNGKRLGLLRRCERYAQLTIPSVCPDDSYDEGNDELSHSLHSIGAQAVNNLINKMILAMFAPSRPFMKIDLPPNELHDILTALEITEGQFREEMSIIEMTCVKKLDEISARPKLFDMLAHLIVTGNCLRFMDEGVMRIIGIKDFVSRRNNRGEVIEIMLRELVSLDELPEGVSKFANTKDSDDKVSYFRWWRWDAKRKLFIENQWIDNVLVDDQTYKGQYKREDMPVSHHVWRITDKANYGIGQVEDNIGDLEGVNELTESEVNGAILASEFRWVMNPGGFSRPEDFKQSQNGDVIPGSEGDLVLVTAGAIGQSIAVVSTIAEKFVRRIGAAFLLSSSVQRDAERVTAEEIRLLANELETGLGGVYSRLAIDVQLPLARWLMQDVDLGKVFKGSNFKPVIVTGLDALSRNGDLENRKLFLQDIAMITTLPPEVQDYLKLDNIFSELAAGRGLRASDLVRGQEEVDQRRADMQAQQQKAMQDQMAIESAYKQQEKGNQ